MVEFEYNPLKQYDPSHVTLAFGWYSETIADTFREVKITKCWSKAASTIPTISKEGEAVVSEVSVRVEVEVETTVTALDSPDSETNTRRSAATRIIMTMDSAIMGLSDCRPLGIIFAVFGGSLAKYPRRSITSV
ncbi:MAG: hypothetical protein JRN03_02285 [Nitrososphaerota archaeon]|nr:hypothetical protein [Nitrososphaerota archaeon]